MLVSATSGGKRKRTWPAYTQELYGFQALTVTIDSWAHGSVTSTINLPISLWPSLPTFLYSADSLSPLCDIIAFPVVKYAFMNPAITGIMPLKNGAEEPHVAIGVHHSYLVPAPN